MTALLYLAHFNKKVFLSKNKVRYVTYNISGFCVGAAQAEAADQSLDMDRFVTPDSKYDNVQFIEFVN